MNIQILVDDKESWFVKYAKKLQEIISLNNNCNLIYSKNNISVGDILFILGCKKILSEKYLKKNKYNIVVHESKLPSGRGWSPVTWQVLEDINIIPVTLFNATKEVDCGDIYFIDNIILNGNELIEEIREKQAQVKINLCLKFIENINNLQKIYSNSQSSFYKKRTKEDSLIDINKSIKDQFNLLRVCDNTLYPAYFIYKNCKYILQIKKEEI
jgi:methionyl-tRNA formyltransferase